MSSLHRIQWIDMHIRAKKYPNCRTIDRQCLWRDECCRSLDRRHFPDVIELTKQAAEHETKAMEQIKVILS